MLINAVTEREFEDVEPIPIKITYYSGDRKLHKDYFLLIPRMHPSDIQKYVNELISEDVIDIYRSEIGSNKGLAEEVMLGVASPGRAKEIYDEIADAINDAYMVATTRELP